MFTARWCNLCSHSEGRLRRLGQQVDGNHRIYLVDVENTAGGRDIALEVGIDQVCSSILAVEQARLTDYAEFSYRRFEHINLAHWWLKS